jgi:hypothetical protein
VEVDHLAALGGLEVVEGGLLGGGVLHGGTIQGQPDGFQAGYRGGGIR